MGFAVEVLVETSPGRKEWRKVAPSKPTEKQPFYVYATKRKANKVKYVCYPSFAATARVVEVPEEPNID